MTLETYQIAVLIGSLRKESLNRKLAEALYRLAPSNLTLTEAAIGDLPLYNQDYDDHQANSVKQFKAQIAKADGLIFVTPEYNHSVPGVLKNAIDHASRPYGKSAWTGKSAGILGISPAPTGTSMSQMHLRNIMAALSADIMPQPDVFIQDDDFFGPDNMPRETKRDMLQKWVNSYAKWITCQESRTTGPEILLE